MEPILISSSEGIFYVQNLVLYLLTGVHPKYKIHAQYLTSKIPGKQQKGSKVAINLVPQNASSTCRMLICALQRSGAFFREQI
jgi:hypothetical protein